MIIAHLADLQLGYGRFGGKPNVARYHDFFGVFDAAIKKIEEVDAKMVLIAGDVFDHSTPTTNTQFLFLHAIHRLESAGRAVYIIGGNHDTPKTDGVCHPLALVDARDNEYIQVACGNVVRVIKPQGYPSVCMIPWRHGIPLREDDFKPADICMVHAALPGMAEEYVKNCDRVITDLDWVKQYKYVALGDWHSRYFKPPNMQYPGSLERTSFGDVKSDLGMVLLNWDDMEKGEWMATTWDPPARTMLDYSLDLKDCQNPQDFIYDSLAALKKQDPEAMIRLTISGVDPVIIDRKYILNSFPMVKLVWTDRPEPDAIRFGPRSLIDGLRLYGKQANLSKEVVETMEDVLLQTIEEDAERS